MANRESAVTIDAFALEEELNELLQAEARGKKSTGGKDGLGSRVSPEILPREPTRPISSRKKSSRQQTHPSTRVLGNSGYGTSVYTWASGAQGSIFSRPEANSPAPPPPAVTHDEVDNTPPGLRRMRSQATLRSQASYSLFPSPPPPTDRQFAQDLFRTNFENIHGSPDYLGRYPTPFPMEDSEQLLVLEPQSTPMNGAPAREQRECGCLAPVAELWKGLGKLFLRPQ